MGIKDILLDFLFNELIIMNENIDLTKILKDCPKGWKFYSSIYGDVAFREIKNDSVNPIKFFLLDEDNIEKYGSCTAQGLYAPYYKGECTFFPSKEQRDWSKFTAPWYNPEKQDEDKKEINNFDVLPGLYKCVHRMFDGTPNDRLLFETGNVYKCLSKHDRAKFEGSYGQSIYFEDPVVYKHFIPFKSKVNKFDPNILQPFDKVLVRDTDFQNWSCGLFSHIVVFDYICKYNVGEILYTMCIPYNDETKYLVGTIKEAPEYYRYWEN